MSWNSKASWMRLTRAANRTVGSRRHSREPPEHIGEVTLIVEAGGKRDFAERSVCFGNLTACEFDAHSPDEIAYRASEVPAKLASQVDRMNAGACSQLGQGRRLGNSGSKPLPYLVEPRRDSFLSLLRRAAREFGHHLERQTFNRKPRP